MGKPTLMDTVSWDNYTHINILLPIVKGLKMAGCNNKYLELGISKAKCFNTCARYFKKAIGVDIVSKWESRIQKKIMKGTKVIFHAMSTDDFFKQNKEDNFDFIFVDACHEFKQAKRDFIDSWLLLKPNGIMILHDTYPPSKEFLEHCEDCHRLPNWIKYHYDNAELVTLPFYFGVTIIRKLGGPIPWLQ